MRRTAFLLLLVGLAGLAIPLHAQVESQFLIPLSTPDGKRAVIGPNDLAFAEDGKALKVLKVEPRDAPLHVTLALDNSRGLADNFVMVREGAKAFIDAMPPEVEVALVSTAPQGRIVVKSTTDHTALKKGVDAIAADAGAPRFIESFVDWSDRIDKDKDKNKFTPVLVILGSTFGEEMVRENDVKKAVDRLPVLNATVHVIMFNAKTNQGGSSDAQIAVAENITSRTRGKLEQIGTYLRLAPALSEMGTEVAKMQTGGQYLVTVERPAGSPKNRLGALGVTAPAGIIVGRISMVAPKD
jgi:hypothetical protein